MGAMLLIMLVLAAIWTVRHRRGLGTRYGESAGDVLRRRYAAGEIDEEEYRRRKRELEQQ